MSDLIDRAAAIEDIRTMIPKDARFDIKWIEMWLMQLPSAQPKQRYTEEELRVFRLGISHSLLSKLSAQHWQYDKDTATEIEFLERLYDKVSADMKGGQG